MKSKCAHEWDQYGLGPIDCWEWELSIGPNFVANRAILNHFTDMFWFEYMHHSIPLKNIKCITIMMVSLDSWEYELSIGTNFVANRAILGMSSFENRNHSFSGLSNTRYPHLENKFMCIYIQENTKSKYAPAVFKNLVYQAAFSPAWRGHRRVFLFEKPASNG